MNAPRPRTLVVAAGVLAVALVPVLTPNIFIQNVLILTFVLAIGASGWNIMAGTGYVSLGHGVFIGVGAYAGGILAERAGVSPFVMAPVGGVAAALLALLLSVATRRTRGAAFVIVTFAVLELMSLVVRNSPSLTGGSKGFLMPLPTWDVRFTNWPFYYSLLAVLLLSVGLAAVIARSKLGLGLVAIHDDEDKAAGIGISTPVYKSVAFMASAVLVGVAGTLYGYYLSFLNPGSTFDIVFSIEVVLAALLGGRGTVWGPVLGAAILQPISELTNTTLGGAASGSFRLIMFGGLLLAVTLLLPRGIIPELDRLLSRLRRRGAASPTGSRLGEAAIPAVPPSARDLGRTPAEQVGALLEIRSVTRAFGGVRALDGATLDVPAGSITALIGPNGSGKTTLFNIIDGTFAPGSGDVRFRGASITGLGRTRRATAGIGRTYQLPRLFDSLSVLENVAAANGAPRLGRLLRSAVTGAEAQRATELLEFVGLGEFAAVGAGQLSYGQRKLVELAQVLMLDPEIILLDEPCAGINPTLIARLGSLIRALNASGRTFLVVEHDMPFVLGLCDPVVVLARGAVIAAGPPDQVSADAEVQEAYLGSDLLAEAGVGEDAGSAR